MADFDNHHLPEDNAHLPVVAGDRPSNWGMWIFFAVLCVGGIWLFSALSANRAELQAPATVAQPSATGGRIVSGPPLALSQDASTPAIIRQADRRPPSIRLRPAPVQPPPLPPARSIAPPAPPFNFQPPVAEPAGTARPSVVFDSAFQRTSPPEPPSVSPDAGRVRAARFQNPSRTIPQGTVIPAVLETALDSTRAGAARALVQRDIYGFDGTRILIHRGSRLYGEYDSGLEAGQNRALIQWSRLIRPDGVTVALDSPSSDPLGRAGVKGKVDGKFLQRFGGAILQSILDIGVGVATREASSDGVIVALPGSTQNLQINDQQRVQRTLKVKHGTSVSVFVARDLDFSTVEQ